MRKMVVTPFIIHLVLQAYFAKPVIWQLSQCQICYFCFFYQKSFQISYSLLLYHFHTYLFSGSPLGFVFVSAVLLGQNLVKLRLMSESTQYMTVFDEWQGRPGRYVALKKNCSSFYTSLLLGPSILGPRLLQKI